MMLAAVAAHQATAGYNDRPGSMVVGMPWARRRAHVVGTVTPCGGGAHTYTGAI